MNGTKNLISPKNCLMKWPVLCGLSGLLLAQMALGQQQVYSNNAVVVNAPNIDAINFINNGSFSASSSSQYETKDTLNYLNSGTMNGSGGFLFDTLTSGFRYMASSFYNGVRLRFQHHKEVTGCIFSRCPVR